MPTGQYIGRRITELYKAVYGTATAPSDISIRALSGAGSGEVKLCADFNATGMQLGNGGTIIDPPSGNVNYPISWNLTGTGAYRDRLKITSSFNTDSSDLNVIIPKSIPLDTTNTYWSTKNAKPTDVASIYLFVSGSSALPNLFGSTFTSYTASITIGEPS